MLLQLSEHSRHFTAPSSDHHPHHSGIIGLLAFTEHILCPRQHGAPNEVVLLLSLSYQGRNGGSESVTCPRPHSLEDLRDPLDFIHPETSKADTTSLLPSLAGAPPVCLPVPALPHAPGPPPSVPWLSSGVSFSLSLCLNAQHAASNSEPWALTLACEPVLVSSLGKVLAHFPEPPRSQCGAGSHAACWGDNGLAHPWLHSALSSQTFSQQSD